MRPRAKAPEPPAEITRGDFRIDARTVPLTAVAAVWTDTTGEERGVVTP